FNFEPSTLNIIFCLNQDFQDERMERFRKDETEFILFVLLRAFASSWRFNLQLSTINHQPSTINHQPSTINLEPSTLNIIFCLNQDFQDERMERFRKDETEYILFALLSLRIFVANQPSTFNLEPSTLNIIFCLNQD